MSGPVRTRLACDRCHSQKLRCPKQPGSAICTRCLKAGASCVYSPPGTNSSFGNGSSIGMTGSMMMADGVSGDSGSSAEAFDWDTYDVMDFNTLLQQPSPLEPQAHCQLEHAIPTAVADGIPVSTPCDGPSDDLDNPRLEYMKRLTDLLMDTDKLWAKLPQLSTSHMPRNDPHELYLKALTEKAATKSMLENLFIIAQQLTELYPPATALVFSREADSTARCTIPNCTHEVELPPVLRPLEEWQAAFQGDKASRVDAALANVLISCHLRLLDALDRVFMLVTSCTRATLASPERKEPEFALTEMRVGSFVPHRAVAVLMHMALLKHLMSSLSDKLASLGEAIASQAGDSGGENLETRILEMQHRSLTKRHTGQMQHVRTIEEFLSSYDLDKI